ncbi:MAG: hypothetical protein MUC48_19325 [Leptolyngbya sp. Prado105]|nr:hypothetical protein [Leptolyngbya sp. Prado105]
MGHSDGVNGLDHRSFEQERSRFEQQESSQKPATIALSARRLELFNGIVPA